ncbi:Imm1 family immunity protein [Actinoallomurus iriomotensis]|uniref:Uncharacterized protein n=1 Tax=Actinoallomurus iriomotensis TaxID=478107 RepID=A0A9W6VK58_9ACTN|nr:Imm1 family immunity protein [Actinoallomurus iriomotensis]GLY74873.1 hypothetical protein Airi01_031400 [Actinoallomurus iriomotensis]
MSLTGEVRQQVVGVMELSAQARESVEEAGELLDSAARRLTAVLTASRDPQAAQAVRSLLLAQERLVEVAGLFGWVTSELPVFLSRLDQAPSAPAGAGPAVTTSHRRGGEKGTSVSRPERPEEPEAPEEKSFMGWWGTRSREVADAGTAESVIGEAADRLLTGGPRGVAIRFGKGEREQAPLRIYIDTSAGRAAVSWQGSAGVESGVDPDEALVVEEHPKRPPVTIPPERARVTPATAIRAAREYVETGRRPTCLNWNADPPPSRVEEIRSGEAT